MMNNKFTGGMLMALAMTTLTAVSAFAADTSGTKLSTATAAPNSALYGVETTVSTDENSYLSFTEAGMGDKKDLDIKTDENGKQYLVTKDGEKVYISVKKATNGDSANGTITFTPAK